ncbi:DUF6531 domain-containing protein [Nocardia xishanensis]
MSDDSNSLIAQRDDSTEWYTGVSLFESVNDLSDAISSGSWIEAGLGIAGIGAEVASVVVDPLGTLASYGVGFLIEHVEPLSEALDWVAGDPDQIAAYAETWSNVSDKVGETVAAHRTALEQDIADWSGAAAGAYKARGRETADALAAAQSAAAAASNAIEMAGGIVAAVRTTVRDIVAQAVGRLAAWAAEALFSFGVATPVIAAQATTYVAKTLTTIANLFQKLARTMAKLTPLLRRLKGVFGDIAKKLRGKSSGTADTTPAGAKPPKGKPDNTDTKPQSADGAEPESNAPSSKPDSSQPDTGKADTDKEATDQARKNDPRDNQKEADRTECGDPVDAATGEFLLPATDIELPGLLPLTLNRMHRSGYRFGRWFGPSWSCTFDVRVIVDQQGVTFVGEDGLLLTYPHAGPGVPVLPANGGQRWPMTRTESGGYQVHEPDREITWQFFPSADRVGALLDSYSITSIVDRYRNRILFSYDADGNPAEVSHSGGYRVRVDTADDRITALTVLGANPTDAETKVREFVYESGELVSVTNGVRAVTRFTYDDEHRMLSWKDSNGNQLVNMYDEAGRVVRQRGNSGIVNAEFDYFTSHDGATRRTLHTDSLGATTTYVFDADLRLRERVDPGGACTRTEYNSDRRPTKVIGPDGATKTYRYNADGDLTTIVRPDGHRIDIDYHARDRPCRVVTADGAVYQQEYDDNGDRVAVIDPAGIRTEYTYHSTGAIATIRQATGAITNIAVDGAGLPIAVTDSGGGHTRVDRDHLGRPVSVTDPLGAVTRYQWNGESKLLRRTGPEGQDELWSYDGENNLVLHADPNQGITRYQYGAFDLLNQKWDPTGAVTRYTWDTEQRLTSVINPLGQTWRYIYDPAGRLISETDYTGATTTLTHDRAGRVETVTPATGVTRRYSYDSLGRLTGIEADTGEWLSYSYDLAGRTRTAVSGAGDTTVHTVEFGYAADGRLIAQRVDGRLPTIYHYDETGARTRRTSPTGSETHWRHDITGRVRTLATDGHSIEFTYNPAGCLTAWAVDALTIARRVSSTGLLTAQDVIAVPRALAPDTNLRPVADPAARPIRHDEYTYRADGYPVCHSTIRPGKNPRHRRYDLDRIGRVTAVVDNGTTTEQYAYDQLNNVIRAQTFTASVNFTDAEATGPITVEHALDTNGGRREFHNNLLVRDGRTRYHYDAAGRLVRRTRTRLSRRPDVWHYRYNAFDQLTDVWTPDHRHWHYTYDALGRRTTKQHISGDHTAIPDRTDYTWDGTHLIEETTARSTTRWSYQPGTYTPLTQATEQSAYDREFFAVITDLVGTPIELIDPSTGDTAATATIDLWGRAGWYGTASTPLRFPGQYYDAETGLHYNHHRQYDPGTGRFLTRDPLGLAPAANPNTYPHNPTAWLDPLGLSCTDNPSSPRIPEGEIPVIGRLQDTSVAIDWPGHHVLDVDDWTLELNDQWVQSIINENRVVYVASPQTPATLVHPTHGQTVFARELEQFRNAGYRQVGDYLFPPGS